MSTTTVEPNATATQDGQEQAQAPAGEPAGTQSPTPADVAAQQAAQDAQQASDDPWADPTKARAEIERLRRENASERTNAKQAAADEARAELLATLQRALGGDEQAGQETPTVESLAEQVATERTAREQAEADARTARVELAVFRAATDHRADAQALLDSRTFTDSLAEVDPTDSEAVTNAIKDFVTKNPRFLTQAVGASSADHAGGSGEGAITPEQFKQMSGHERNELARRDPALYNRLTGRE